MSPINDDNYSSEVKVNRDFDKVLCDVNEYVYVDEPNVNLQKIYNTKKYLNDLKEKYSVCYHDALTDYDEIIKTAAEFIKELGLAGNATSYYAIFSYLLWNGMFSKNGEYRFNCDDVLSLYGFEGLDIMNGHGCCRNNANLFNLILRQMNFDTRFLVNSFKIKYLTHVMDIGIRNKDGLVGHMPLEKKMNSGTLNGVGDHASVLLQRDGNYYIYDPTNLQIYKVNGGMNAKLYNGIGECHIKPWGFFLFEDMDRMDVIKLLFKLRCQDKSKFKEDAEIRETIDDTVELCKKNKSLILDFHSQISRNINNINKNIFEKK